MLFLQLSYPHNIKKGANHEQISKVITCIMVLPISSAYTSFDVGRLMPKVSVNRKSVP